HLLGDQALAKGHQGACAEGRRVAVKTIEHQLPPPIHRGGFNDFVIGDPRVGLENRRQGQAGGWYRGLALGLVLIESQQFLLEDIGQQLMAMLPQEHKQLRAANTFDNSVFGQRQLKGWMPQGWTHGKPSFWNGKKTMVSHANTSRKNTRPMF